ncbi:adhesion G-protein coupled receptor D1-like [Amphiura filiformis]|uniref:adhesion G-protein coupled receptor D1-like n=1 Tax=Amphiura filiformis TaxID=82378 RepID=UPI003B2113E6
MALLAAQMSFLLGADQTSNQTLCKITAMTIHYLYMCVFCWMLVEGINLFIKVVLVFNTEKSKLMYYALLGWGMPIVIVAVCAGVAWGQYATKSSCWIGSGNPLIWSFAGPAAVIILLNLILLCIVARILYRSIRSVDKAGSDKIKAFWTATKGTLTLTPLLGITWIFGFMAVGGATLVFQYIFIVLNSLQGVLFFLFFCFLNKEVREKVKRLFEKMKLSSAQFSSSSVAPEKPLMMTEKNRAEMRRRMSTTVDTTLQGNDLNEERLKQHKEISMKVEVSAPVSLPEPLG